MGFAGYSAGELLYAVRPPDFRQPPPIANRSSQNNPLAGRPLANCHGFFAGRSAERRPGQRFVGMSVR
jgi:hypothetical protein